MESFALNLSLFQTIHGLSGIAPLLDALGTFLALYLPYLLGAAIIVFIFRQKTAREKLGAFLTFALATLISRGILAEAIGFLLPTARPFSALGFTPLIGGSGAAFPSGHAAFFFALGFALFLFDKRWAVWFLMLSFVVGLARIFVGVHYPLDILGGIAVAFVSYLIVKALIKPGRPEAVAVSESPVNSASEAPSPRQVV